MSQEIEKILFNGLLDLGDDIARAIIEQGLEDTGASQRFEVDFNGNKVTLYGAPHLIYLVEGRAPGKFPPVDKIQDYVERNNIRIEFNGQELSAQQTAYLIGKGIAEKGSRIYRKEIPGLPLDELINSKLDEIMPRVADQALKNVISILTK